MWSLPAESRPEWTGRINVGTYAASFAPPLVAEEAVVCLAGDERDVDVVEDVLLSWFPGDSAVIDDAPHEVLLRLMPPG
ncbi:hypothetical protein BGM19_00580 [Streptomyces agglomeratus]|nr:hypothetical protein BGM19_00580 [Streptomyces agglomeratus]